jgi:hypothetical protein
MKKIAMTLAFGLVASAATWTGYLVDAKCGKAHGNDKGKGCSTKCIAGGQDAQLVVGDNVYKLDAASQAAAKAYVAAAKEDTLKVTVKGKIKGDTITLAKKKAIAAAK